MKWPKWKWAVVLVILATPVGLRAAKWWTHRPRPISPEVARAGEVLFRHEWTSPDPLAPGGDGLGPVYNATSCLECHNQGGAGGGGLLNHNVTTFTVEARFPGGKAREGVVHAFALQDAETLADVHPQLPAINQPVLDQLVSAGERVGTKAIAFPKGVHISQRNTPALFGAKLIDDLPARVIIANERKERVKWGMARPGREDVPVGRVLRLADGRVGRFGWKGQTASLADFVQAACANELGLGNPGQAQPRHLRNPGAPPTGLDLTLEQCAQLTAFVGSLPRPVERVPADPEARRCAGQGKRLFQTVGCADCHTPDLGPVQGVYSDLLLHRMGETLVGGGGYNEPPPQSPSFPPSEGPQPGEWRTPPLWGVADSGPYLHDGRAATLEQAIQLHGGQAARAVRAFASLSPAQQTQIIAFLGTLRAP